MSQPDGSLIPNLDFLNAIVQDNTLLRQFQDPLFTKSLYRGEATPEQWQANVGDTQVFTKSSVLPVRTKALTPYTDPDEQLPSFEQWRVQASQYSGSMNTHMPSSFVDLAPLLARNTHTLGLQAGETLNLNVRDRLFAAYESGDTIIGSNSAVGVTTFEVASIAGFTSSIVGGQQQPVSTVNPVLVKISGFAGQTFQVIQAVPTDPGIPLGPGFLTLSAPINTVAGSRVVALNAPLIVRTGNVTSVDGLTPTDTLTVQDIRQAVATMRRNSVPMHNDGFYHVHLDPQAESQLYNDNEFQRLQQSLPEGIAYRDFAIGTLLGCVFYSNSASPNVYNSAPQGEAGLIQSRPEAAPLALASPQYYGEVRNKDGVGILRTIVTGKDSIMEKWIDENSAYSSSAGYTGQVGRFNVVNGGVQVNTERTRYILRAPVDKLQQTVSGTWSFSGDWGVPTDLLGGMTGSKFKRACVIESGSAD